MGAAFVALLLIAGEPIFKAGAAGEARPGEAPLMVGGFGVQLSAASETRVGEAPILAGEAPRAFVAEIVTPRLELERRRPDFTFQIFYGPRFFWEYPNPDTTSRTQLLGRDTVTRIRGIDLNTETRWAPLVLHTGGLNFTTRASRRVSMVAFATGSIGSPDYTELPQLLGTIQGTLPPILSLASADAEAKARFQMTRRWELSLLGHFGYWHWLNATTDSTLATAQGTTSTTSATGQNLVTGQTSILAEPEATYLVTPRDWLGLGAAVGEALYSNGVGVSMVTPVATWKTRLTESTNFKIVGGVTYARALGATPPGMTPVLGAGGSAAAPIGSFELYSRVMGRDQLAIQTDVSGGVDYYVDTVLGTAISRATAVAGLTLGSVPHWMVSLTGRFATALRRTAYETLLNGMPVPGALPPDETAFDISLSFRRWMSESFLAEVGGRWADRGPALVTPDFQFHQRQLWIYIALTATTRPIARLAH